MLPVLAPHTLVLIHSALVIDETSVLENNCISVNGTAIVRSPREVVSFGVPAKSKCIQKS